MAHGSAAAARGQPLARPWWDHLGGALAVLLTGAWLALWSGWDIHQRAFMLAPLRCDSHWGARYSQSPLGVVGSVAVALLLGQTLRPLLQPKLRRRAGPLVLPITVGLMLWGSVALQRGQIAAAVSGGLYPWAGCDAPGVRAFALGLGGLLVILGWVRLAPRGESVWARRLWFRRGRACLPYTLLLLGQAALAFAEQGRVQHGSSWDQAEALIMGAILTLAVVATTRLPQFFAALWNRRLPTRPLTWRRRLLPLLLLPGIVLMGHDIEQQQMDQITRVHEARPTIENGSMPRGGEYLRPDDARVSVAQAPLCTPTSPAPCPELDAIAGDRLRPDTPGQALVRRLLARPRPGTRVRALLPPDLAPARLCVTLDLLHALGIEELDINGYQVEERLSWTRSVASLRPRYDAYRRARAVRTRLGTEGVSPDRFETWQALTTALERGTAPGLAVGRCDLASSAP